jgi:DNA repair photolyase
MNAPLSKGRGSSLRPPNRFGEMQAELDLEHVAGDDEYLAVLARVPTEYLPDASRSIISENDSPDLPFRYSLNPYRGCQHGCAYCYARPTHEYLGLNAGIDFESKIFFKPDAPRLFRDWLARDNYQPSAVMLSGVTDCYQPAEREYQLTRGCLEVAVEACQPLALVTKNALVTRDVDLLQQLAALQCVGVAVSLTTLDPVLQRTLEPRSSSPQARLRTIAELRSAGIPTRAMIAPVIPGLNDHEVPQLLQAAAEAGAQSAGYILLRLPLTVQPVFLDWLQRTQPTKAERVEAAIRETREGKLNNSEFGARFRGRGLLADQIRQTFQVFSRRLGLAGGGSPLETRHFRPPRPTSGQMRLF